MSISLLFFKLSINTVHYIIINTIICSQISEITSSYKGGGSNFVDKKGALVKRVGQGWGSDPSPHTELLNRILIILPALHLENQQVRLPENSVMQYARETWPPSCVTSMHLLYTSSPFLFTDYPLYFFCLQFTAQTVI